MKIRSSVRSSATEHHVVVSTDDRVSTVAISGKPGGGSALNGGELLCAAIATCYCNDVYREAARRGLTVRGVVVDVEAEFGGRGDPATRISYSAQIDSDASATEIAALLRETDTVAEVHNTLRAGVAVELREAE